MQRSLQTDQQAPMFTNDDGIASDVGKSFFGAELKIHRGEVRGAMIFLSKTTHFRWGALLDLLSVSYETTFWDEENPLIKRSKSPRNDRVCIVQCDHTRCDVVVCNEVGCQQQVCRDHQGGLGVCDNDDIEWSFNDYTSLQKEKNTSCPVDNTQCFITVTRRLGFNVVSSENKSRTWTFLRASVRCVHRRRVFRRVLSCAQYVLL